MEETRDRSWEQSLEKMAGRFEYPPTPDVIGRLRMEDAGHHPGHDSRSAARRPALAFFLLVLALLVALVAVPQTRAALVSWFARIGAIEIFVDDTAPTPAPAPASSPSGDVPATMPPTVATEPTLSSGPVEHSLSLVDLGEPVTLAEAERRVGFTPQLPGALGEPDGVYLHRGVDLPAVTLVWHEPDGPPLSLTAIGIAEFARKFVSEQGVVDTTVGNHPAVWLTGPHTLQLLGNWQGDEMLIASNVLIWVQDGITYRLEGDLTLDGAREIAASVNPKTSEPSK